MWKAKILGPWSGGISQVFIDHYAPGLSVSDDTGQPVGNVIPNPNLKIDYVECDKATLDLIDADPTYDVLYSEEIIDAQI